MNQKKSEDAVSPVIGVMLLLVVTIVIAAVVAVFASGVGTDVEPAPATAVDVDEISDGYSTILKIKSKPSGYTRARNQWIDESGIVVPSNEAKYREYYIVEGGNKVVFARLEVLDSSSDPPKTGEPYVMNGRSDLFKTYTRESNEKVDERTITLSCLHGESIDLSKISIQIDFTNLNGNYHFEFPRNTYSGSLSVGDKTKLKLESSDSNIEYLMGGQEVDVTVFYGDYVLVSDKLIVT